MANYLYNGVELPPLPEWDKKKYPFAMVDYSSATENYRVWFLSTKAYRGSFGIVMFSGSGMVSDCSDGVWELIEEWDADGSSDIVPLTPKWTNYDYLDYDVYSDAADGTVILAASYPINAETGEEIRDYAPTPILAPVIEPLSMWLGWKAGNWVARQRGKKKQPVAFLYNGVRLPELPEWDKTVYPYAVILSSQSTYANLIVSTVPLYYTPVKSGFSTTHRLGAKADGSMLAFVYDSTNDDEVKRTSFVRDPDRDVEGFTAKENVKTLTLTSPKWANYDLLYYADDTVCVTASEPVPVYD